MGQFSIDKMGIAARMRGAKTADLADEASHRLAHLAVSGAAVESDGKLTLWNRAVAAAKKAVVAGMVALTALTAVAPAMAQVISKDTKTHAATYLADANQHIAQQWWFNRKISGITVEDIASMKPGTMPEVKATKVSWSADDSACRTFVIKIDTTSKDYLPYLNLPDGVSLEDVEAVDNVSFCMLQNHLDQKHFDYYADKIGGVNNVADALSLLGVAKTSGKEAYDSMLNLKVAEAASQAKSSDPTTRLHGVLRLATFGTVDDAVKRQHDGFDRLAKMDYGDLVGIAMYTRRDAENSIKEALGRGALDIDALQGVSSAKMMHMWAKDGPYHAFRAVSRIAGSGLLKYDASAPAVGDDNCAVGEECKVLPDVLETAYVLHEMEAYQELIKEGPRSNFIYRGGVK